MSFVVRAAGLSTWVLATVLAGGCADRTQITLPEPASGNPFATDLQEWARLAHRDGKSDVYGDYLDEMPATKDEVATQAVAVVRASGVTPQSGQGGLSIMTWYEVETLRVIRPPSALVPPVTCARTTPPPGIRPNARHWAVMLPGGTVVVDGVRVTARYDDEHRHLQPGRAYLLFGQLCARTFVRWVILGKACSRSMPTGTSTPSWIDELG